MAKFIDKTIEAAHSLIIFRNIADKDIFQSYVHLNKLISGKDKNLGLIHSVYNQLCGSLIDYAVYSGGQIRGDIWQNYLVDCVLEDNNVFSTLSERIEYENMDECILRAAEYDMKQLKGMFDINSRIIKESIFEIMSEYRENPWFQGNSYERMPDWNFTGKSENNADNEISSRFRIKQKFFDSENWAGLIKELARFFYYNGSGIFNRYRAFKYESNNGTGRIKGISQPDPIRMDNLIGYNLQKEKVIRNTEKLLSGYGGNNMLLYGDKGTGKSSMVKALLNEYADRGLRMIEISKKHLKELPHIINSIKGRNLKFILFVDDLSFNENESEYIFMKAILEGGLEILPSNGAIYTTSNRRHLVKEYFADRNYNASDDEVRIQDTLQEKLSLADRFGITVVFTAPSQKEYLEIVKGLAVQRGFDLPEDELRRQAVQWELKQNGRSGRTAKQFIDYISGEKIR